MAKSSTGLTASVHQMLSGLEANTAEVTKLGATAEFTKSGETLLASVEAMEAERETLKATLKTKTASLDIAIAQLKTWNSEASRAVKRTYHDQKEKWAEFGINLKVKAKKSSGTKKH